MSSFFKLHTKWCHVGVLFQDRFLQKNQLYTTTNIFTELCKYFSIFSFLLCMQLFYLSTCSTPTDILYLITFIILNIINTKFVRGYFWKFPVLSILQLRNKLMSWLYYLKQLIYLHENYFFTMVYPFFHSLANNFFIFSLCKKGLRCLPTNLRV